MWFFLIKGIRQPQPPHPSAPTPSHLALPNQHKRLGRAPLILRLRRRRSRAPNRGIAPERVDQRLRNAPNPTPIPTIVIDRRGDAGHEEAEPQRAVGEGGRDGVGVAGGGGREVGGGGGGGDEELGLFLGGEGFGLCAGRQGYTTIHDRSTDTISRSRPRIHMPYLDRRPDGRPLLRVHVHGGHLGLAAPLGKGR